MEALKKKIIDLFESNSVNLVIAYREGLNGMPKAYFINIPTLAENLIYNDNCKQNLVTYLHKPEIKSVGKIAFVANLPALKTVLQLASENQVKEGDYIYLTVDKQGNIIQFSNFSEIENYVSANPERPPEPMLQKKAELMQKSLPDRWEFWNGELSNCIKCYACRSACPLCYCTQCTADCNQPQWIPVISSGLGNLEWHIMRAMHLAGRCIGCGECVRACPMDIPLGLITAKLNEDIAKDFGQRAGMTAKQDYALSSFKVEDKENFIR